MRTRNWFSHWVCYQIKLKCPLSRIHQWSENKFNLGPPIKTEDRESVRRTDGCASEFKNMQLKHRRFYITKRSFLYNNFLLHLMIRSLKIINVNYVLYGISWSTHIGGTTLELWILPSFWISDLATSSLSFNKIFCQSFPHEIKLHCSDER